MFTVKMSSDDCRSIMTDVYEMQKNPIGTKVTYTVLPKLFKKGFDKFTDNKICINLIYGDIGRHYKFILVKKDSWNNFTVTERDDRGKIINRFDTIYQRNQFEIHEISPEFRRTFLGPFQRMNRTLNIYMEKKNESRADIYSKEMEEDWYLSSVVSLSYIFCSLCYILDYQLSEYENLKEHDREITINIHKYHRNIEKKAEGKRLKPNKSSLLNGHNGHVKEQKTDHIESDISKTIKELKNEVKKALEEKDKYKYLFEQEKMKNTELASLKKKYKDDQFELNKLREELKRLTVKDIKEEFDIESMVEAIKDIKVLFIGGHENWHNRLSEYIPNMTVIGHDDYGVDYNVIYNADLIYFFTNYIGHGVHGLCSCVRC